MIHPLVMAALSVSVTPFLSGGDGGTVQQIDGISPYDTTVGIRFNADGTIETGKSLNGAAITWSPAGNWINPAAAISGNEEVRFTNLIVNSGSGDWTTEAAADDTWIDITSTRTWLRNRTTVGTNDFDVDFQVRDTVIGLPTGSSFYSFIANNIT